MPCTAAFIDVTNADPSSVGVRVSQATGSASDFAARAIPLPAGQTMRIYTDRPDTIGVMRDSSGTGKVIVAWHI